MGLRGVFLSGCVTVVLAACSLAFEQEIAPPIEPGLQEVYESLRDIAVARWIAERCSELEFSEERAQDVRRAVQSKFRVLDYPPETLRNFEDQQMNLFVEYWSKRGFSPQDVQEGGQRERICEQGQREVDESSRVGRLLIRKQPA